MRRPRWRRCSGGEPPPGLVWPSPPLRSACGRSAPPPGGSGRGRRGRDLAGVLSCLPPEGGVRRRREGGAWSGVWRLRPLRPLGAPPPPGEDTEAPPPLGGTSPSGGGHGGPSAPWGTSPFGGGHGCLVSPPAVGGAPLRSAVGRSARPPGGSGRWRLGGVGGGRLLEGEMVGGCRATGAAVLVLPPLRGKYLRSGATRGMGGAAWVPGR